MVIHMVSFNLEKYFAVFPANIVSGIEGFGFYSCSWCMSSHQFSNEWTEPLWAWPLKNCGENWSCRSDWSIWTDLSIWLVHFFDNQSNTEDSILVWGGDNKSHFLVALVLVQYSVFNVDWPWHMWRLIVLVQVVSAKLFDVTKFGAKGDGLHDDR